MRTIITSLFLVSALSAQTIKPALPPLHATIVTQKKGTVKPALPSTPSKQEQTDIWIPYDSTYNITTIDPCSWQGAEMGKDGKCHVDIPLLPAGWDCYVPPIEPDKPTVLRCTWEPNK
jgi:hypothetical protein